MQNDYEKYVKLAIEGNREAFGQLYRIFLDRIYRFVYYMVSDEFLAEDITQNTFVRAWNSLPNFSPSKGTFQSYLYKIARNLVIDNQRRHHEVSLELTFGENVESHENLEEQAWKNESMQKVRDALSSLDSDDRQILVLRYFEDLQFDEIAVVVGKKSGAIRVKVHRLLAQLKKNLEGKI